MLTRLQTHPQPSCPPQPFSHVLTVADEFALICNWLGKGRVLHPRSEAIRPAPVNAAPMPPAMLMDFEESGRYLITVKVKAANKLTLKPHHVETLRRNAAQLALPLLIAWKRFSVWTLFDVSHLSRRTRLRQRAARRKATFEDDPTAPRLLPGRDRQRRQEASASPRVHENEPRHATSPRNCDCPCSSTGAIAAR